LKRYKKVECGNAKERRRKGGQKERARDRGREKEKRKKRTSLYNSSTQTFLLPLLLLLEKTPSLVSPLSAYLLLLVVYLYQTLLPKLFLRFFVVVCFYLK